MQDTYQVMPDLSLEDYAELKADIAARGVQVAVEYDEDGNIMDGHHRVRACKDLGIKDWPRVVRVGMTDEQKINHALKLNLARRQLSQEQIRQHMTELRKKGWSIRRIAEATDTSVGAVHKATSQVFTDEHVVGKDGKIYPRQVERKPVTLYNPSKTEVEIVKDFVETASPEAIQAVATGKSIPTRRTDIPAQDTRDIIRQNIEKAYSTIIDRTMFMFLDGATGDEIVQTLLANPNRSQESITEQVSMVIDRLTAIKIAVQKTNKLRVVK